MSPDTQATDREGTAIIVLGCRFTEQGRPGPALERRLRKAAEVAQTGPRPLLVVMSGGAPARGLTEAKVMAAWWEKHGPRSVVLPEERSRNTRENAEQTRLLLLAHGITQIDLVTCDSHLPRALREFARVGFVARGHAAPSGHGFLRRMRVRAREWIATRLSSFLIITVCFVGPTAPACRGERTHQDGTGGSSHASITLPPEPGALLLLRQAAREPLPGDRDRFARALLEPGEARRSGAFGLGQLCAEPAEPLPAGVPAIDALLETTAALWALDAEPPSPDDLEVLALALGRCGTDRAERALRSWLETPKRSSLPSAAEAAALGLGMLANRRGALEERTLARLLEKAESEKNPRFLYPIGRIARLPRAVAERTIDVAGKVLVGVGSASRRDAIFALGSAGPRARGALSATSLTKTYRTSERTAALQTLVRLGPEGQEKLDELVLALLEQGIPKKASDPAWVVLLAALHSLEKAKVSSDALDLVRKGPVPKAPDEKTREGRSRAAQRRRIVLLRCRAAEIQAGTEWNHKLLRTCDPEFGPIGKLALLRALDRIVQDDSAQAEVERLATDSDPTVRAAALKMIGSHREHKNASRTLLREARRGDPELKQIALHAIAAHPERFVGESEETNGSAFVLETLSLGGAQPLVEVLALGAAGALGTLTLKPSVERYCNAAGPSAYALGRAARRALALLGDPHRPCDPRVLSEREEPPQKATVSMMSDLGPVALAFDAERAPLAGVKVLGLLSRGNYEGGAIRAAREGFLLEWGPSALAAFSDVPLPSEVAWRGPRPGEFGAGTSGARNGALLSFFLSDAPELAGQKVILGTFSGPFELLVPGDRIDQIQVTRGPATASP